MYHAHEQITHTCIPSNTATNYDQPMGGGDKMCCQPALRQELGQGSFGTAYVGHYRSSGMQCAVPWLK